MKCRVLTPLRKSGVNSKVELTSWRSPDHLSPRTSLISLRSLQAIRHLLLPERVPFCHIRPAFRHLCTSHFSACLVTEAANFSISGASSLSFHFSVSQNTSQCGHLKIVSGSWVSARLLPNRLWNNNDTAVGASVSTVHIPTYKGDTRKSCRRINGFWRIENFTRVQPVRTILHVFRKRLAIVPKEFIIQSTARLSGFKPLVNRPVDTTLWDLF